jgi:ubiquinone/menaquinone biosynthesis C-methylase UbiE
MSLFTIPEKYISYKNEPDDSLVFTKKMDRLYTTFASAYDGFMKVFPLWKIWLSSVIPHIQGRNICEISFGPRWLLSQYNSSLEIHGVDYNETMVFRAKEKLSLYNIYLVQGSVDALPYKSRYFDTVVSTMAFSGYPNSRRALSEMLRITKPGGKIIIVDFNFPEDKNIFGWFLTKIMDWSGDVIRDIDALLRLYDLFYEKDVVGGFGSVQKYIITR